MVVGTPGVKGMHSLLRVIADLLAAGVDAPRIVPVLNRSPRSPKARAEYQRAFADLMTDIDPNVFPLVHVGSSRHVEAMVRDGGRLPSSIGGPIAAAVSAAAAEAGQVHRHAEPVAVIPGSLGFAADDLTNRAAS